MRTLLYNFKYNILIYIYIYIFKIVYNVMYMCIIILWWLLNLNKIVYGLNFSMSCIHSRSLTIIS